MSQEQFASLADRVIVLIACVGIVLMATRVLQ